MQAHWPAINEPRSLSPCSTARMSEPSPSFSTAAAIPSMAALNVMHLSSPTNAVLAALIFNALIIIALVPLALRGVSYRAVGAALLLRRNLLIYGLGGLIVPFVGIKLIDMLLAALGLV